MLLDGKQDAKVIALRLELPPKVTPTGLSGFWPARSSSWGSWTQSVTRLSGARSKKRNHEPEDPVLGDSARTGRGFRGCHGGSPGRWTRASRGVHRGATHPLAEGNPDGDSRDKKVCKRVDYEYERAGTARIFLFFESLVGWRKVTVWERTKSPS